MPQYLVRLAQAHETFRKVELQALADIAGVPLQFVKYEEDVSSRSLSRIPPSSPSSVMSSPLFVLVTSRKKKSQCRVTLSKSIHF